MPSKNVREVRLTLRISKSIDERIARLAEASGQAESVVAAFAVSMGIRQLEAGLLPPDPGALGALVEHLQGSMQEELSGAADQVSIEPARSPVGFKRGPRGDIEALWAPTMGYMAGL